MWPNAGMANTLVWCLFCCCIRHTSYDLPMKMAQIECCETSAYKNSDARDLHQRKQTITYFTIQNCAVLQKTS